jgi:hypothetical protein
MESREQVQAWRERWATVNRTTEREQRAGDALSRLRLLDRLYGAGPSALSNTRLDEEGVWLRMQALRHAYRANL